MTKLPSQRRDQEFRERFRRYALMAGGAVATCGFAETADAATVHHDPDDLTAYASFGQSIYFNPVTGDASVTPAVKKAAQKKLAETVSKQESVAEKKVAKKKAAKKKHATPVFQLVPLPTSAHAGFAPAKKLMKGIGVAGAYDPLESAFFAGLYASAGAIGSIFQASALLDGNTSLPSAGAWDDNNGGNTGYLSLSTHDRCLNQVFGWARITFGQKEIDNSITSGDNFITLHEFAYETSGCEIPEPTGCTLFLLALGAGGLAVHRRRRNRTTETNS